MKKTMRFEEVAAGLRVFEDRLFPAGSLPADAVVEVSSARAGFAPEEGGGCQYILFVNIRPQGEDKPFTEFHSSAIDRNQLKLGIVSGE